MAAASALAVSGCSSGSSAVRHGSALAVPKRGAGYAVSGLRNVHAGTTFFLADPPLFNRTDRPIRVLKVALHHPGPGLRDLGHVTIRETQELGGLIEWAPGDPPAANPENLNPEPAVGLVLPPHSGPPGNRFTMAKLVLDDGRDHEVDELDVTYEQSGHV